MLFPPQRQLLLYKESIPASYFDQNYPTQRPMGFEWLIIFLSSGKWRNIDKHLPGDTAQYTSRLTFSVIHWRANFLWKGGEPRVDVAEGGSISNFSYWKSDGSHTIAPCVISWHTLDKRSTSYLGHMTRAAT